MLSFFWGSGEDDHSSLYRDDIADRAKTGIKNLLAEPLQRGTCCMFQLRLVVA